ncbi:unnamed protein product [Lactuca virosa]|uniref:Uncharacterized protein n=1 Tax=Lactuca virosa TaxID=75947 RepID=A0AAU9LVA1_9ASTR|nr:unnamed protein product [Lactuca virosa]
MKSSAPERFRRFTGLGCDKLAQRQVVFDEDLEGLKQLRALHVQTEKEAKELKEEVVGLSERNRSLVTDLSQSIRQQEELTKVESGFATEK